MSHSAPASTRHYRPAFSCLVAAFAALVAGGASIASAQAAGPTGATIIGTVLDSLRGGTLHDAIVRLEPVHAEAITAANGRFSFRNVAPGKYTLAVLHPMLDTLGIAVVTPEFSIDTGVVEIPVAVPNAISLLSTLCSPAQLARGPAAIIGFVRDPDTEGPVDSTRVTLLFQVNRDPLGMLKDPLVREARPDASGRFRFCGLPEAANGKLQVSRKGLISGDVPVSLDNGLLELRGLSFSMSTKVVAIRTDSVGTHKILGGSARVTGRVLNKRGEPLEGARVTVAGTSIVTLTTRNGQFALDSLPSGTQTVEVRKLGYNVTEKAVELAALVPATTTVTMEAAIPMLAPVKTVAAHDADLEKVGFAERKRNKTAGYFYEGDQIDNNGTNFFATLMMIPSLHVVRAGEWQDQYQVLDRHDPSGCVAFFVDGRSWKELTPGDIVNYVRPEDVQALEVYNSGALPGDFSSANDGKCISVLIWTDAKVRKRKP